MADYTQVKFEGPVIAVVNGDGDYEGTIGESSFRVQIRPADKPYWYDSELEDDEKDAILHAIEVSGTVTHEDWHWHHADSGAFGYTVNLTDADYEARGIEWIDVVQHIEEHAEDTLDEADYSAWVNACSDGRGPDAQADINGVHWVVDAEDVELTRTVMLLDEFKHSAEVQTALDVIKRAYLH